MVSENEVLTKIDELRVAIKNCYMRSRLVRLDVALAEGNCDNVLLELDSLYDYGVAQLHKLQECQVAVSEIKYSGGFSYDWKKRKQAA